jgi:hypothetical protein
MMTEEWGAGKTVIADVGEHAWQRETMPGQVRPGNIGAVLSRDQP